MLDREHHSGVVNDKRVAAVALMNVRPRIVGEFSDSALMKAFGEAGAGIFPTPALSVAAVCEHYKVDMVGETNDIKERFFLISAERKLAHPVARAVSEHAKKMML